MSDEPDHRPGHPAAYASNWRRILAVDASIGVACFAVGVAVIGVWSVVIGAAIGAFGLGYVVLVWRRYELWREHRRVAGLDEPDGMRS
jgi:hypothetical protein